MRLHPLARFALCALVTFAFAPSPMTPRATAATSPPTSRSTPTSTNDRTAPEDAALTPLEVDDPGVTSAMAWHLDTIGARSAWRASLGAGVTVAVVDTGVDATHPDLAGQVIEGATCLDTRDGAADCDEGAADPDGHGTHVAGLIAARADNGVGSAGVAPRSRLLAVRAAEKRCEGSATCLASASASDLAAGIDWAVSRGADIINVSIDPGLRTPAAVVDAIDHAWEKGSVVVMASGNSPAGPLLFAGGSALLVTATDRASRLAPYAPSLDAAPVGVAAPGGRQGDTRFTCHLDGRPIGVLSTYSRAAGDRSGYACLSGTSMAAAQVSGGLALLMSMGFSRDEALERLVETARPSHGLGDGLIDLAAAVARPHPIGVAFRHDGFDNGAPPPAVEQVPVAGPFAVETSGSDNPPLWWFLLGGAVLGGGVTGLAMRMTAHRHPDPDGDPPTPDPQP